MDLRESLEQLARWVARDLTYHRAYPATVERDNGDGTLAVTPDDDVIRGLGMQRVPVRPGVAGTTVRVEPGTRCLVGFHRGSPRSPHIAAFEYRKASGTIILDGGSGALARKGDLVDVLLSSPAPVSGTAIGVITPPLPATPIPVPPGSPFTGFLSIPTPVRGTIIGGAAKVKA